MKYAINISTNKFNIMHFTLFCFYYYVFQLFYIFDIIFLTFCVFLVLYDILILFFFKNYKDLYKRL